ncbi:adhesion G-protein coupled receptor G1 isoform X2 [Gopherus flavomarginatus]|uniref:adhesion G-protein coupled receptor G1 isoform X2 n=1 Tax=Gopherus flavomarginatus TaxID=286002 RepID=UPI0021CBFFC4|nr:adhesion G-protein coupled receptor G1 isoform X2 [Gopherus flavomarginatus]
MEESVCAHRGKSVNLEHPWSKTLTEEHQELGKPPMMDRLLLALLFLLQGVDGSSHHTEDFRFCGERNQTKKSYITYQMRPESNIITIENSAEMLKISAPFEPSLVNCHLPDILGNYRLCLYWYQSDRIFNLTYGKNNYTLSTKAHPSFNFSNPSAPQNRNGVPVLSKVSYAYGRGLRNTSLRSAAVYSFSIRDISKVHEIEEELRNLENYMKNPNKAIGRKTSARAPYGKLLRLESDLEQVMFEGECKTFGTSTVRATVLKIGPNKASQDLPFMSELEVGREVHGFAVNLPRILFAQARGRGRNAERRVLLMDINSQALFQDQNSSKVLGEKVIGITVGNTSVSGLQQDVVLKFFHDQLPRNVTPQCVFWDMDSSHGHGSWKSDGCATEMGNNQTVCRCNHLTYFAVLMMSSPEIDYIHKEYLTIITYIGCIISAVASLFTIFLFCCSRRKHRDGTVNIYIHLNLLGAIFLLDVSFLMTEHLALIGSEAACKAGGMFLHLSLLGCLTWMGIEGYNLYRLVVEVFNTYVEHFMFKLCLVGWGLPIFIVSVIFLANQANYGLFHIEVFESLEKSTNATICWIRAPLIHNIVNLGFFSLVFLFNTAMLGAMVREILRQKNRGHELKHALVLLGLSLVLGIPWALAFFSFSSGSFRLVIIYLFTIINTLQGFLIFLWYWTMVLQVRKLKSYPSLNNSDSTRLPISTSRTNAD